MPRTKEQIEKIKCERKQQIIDCAVELFVLEGYDYVTCDKITKKLGISHGLFFHYFSSKDELLKEIAKNAQEKIFVKTKEISNYNYSPIELLEKFLVLSWETMNAKQESAYYMYLFLIVPFSIKLRAKIKAKTKSEKMWFSYLVNTIKKGQEMGEIITGDPTTIAVCFVDLLIGLCYSKIKLNSYENQKFDTSVLINMFKRKTI